MSAWKPVSMVRMQNKNSTLNFSDNLQRLKFFQLFDFEKSTENPVWDMSQKRVLQLSKKNNRRINFQSELNVEPTEVHILLSFEEYQLQG